MIARHFLDEWRLQAPWPQLAMVEQDLLISQILVEIYKHPKLKDSLAFRGGTALHKLHLAPATRYSEDIDLVQVNAEPIGETLGQIKSVIDPILGKPKWKLNQGRATLYYRYQPIESVNQIARIKIEINTREHFSVLGYTKQLYAIESRWFSGKTEILTFSLEELLGTKLRALYQRKKGRDLFDLWMALQKSLLDVSEMLKVFSSYMAFEDKAVSRANFEENLYDKMKSDKFTDDISPLLSPSVTWDIEQAYKFVRDNIVSHFPGEAWQGMKDDKVFVST